MELLAGISSITAPTIKDFSFSSWSSIIRLSPTAVAFWKSFCAKLRVITIRSLPAKARTGSPSMAGKGKILKKAFGSINSIFPDRMALVLHQKLGAPVSGFGGVGDLRHLALQCIRQRRRAHVMGSNG